MSQPLPVFDVYPAGSMRYAVAELLVKHERATQQFIHNRLQPASSPAEVRAALGEMYNARLAEPSANDKRWALTASGLLHWKAQHLRNRTAATNEASFSAAPKPLEPLTTDLLLLTRGLTRMSSPADRLPMVYRDGALDFKKCARIDGPWRVFPDGTRERQDAAVVSHRTVTIPAREGL